MMQWLESVDLGLLRWINQGWSNSVFDSVFPFLSGNVFFFPLLACVILALWVKGGRRGRVFICLALAAFLLSELVVSNIKVWVDRPRPFLVWDDIIVRVGRGGSGSMPSSHTSTWFALATVGWIYWKSSRWWLPFLASAIAVSRLYNGVHYPSDVFVGACIGILAGIVAVYGGELLWKRFSQWVPFLSANIPSLLHPEQEGTAIASTQAAGLSSAKGKVATDIQYLRLGYLLIGVMLVFRWWYIGEGKIELSEDEAYQWVWSKYLALSYFSKPLMIALTQWCGTHIWGDTLLGVRFFSPVCSAITSLLLLRFLYREANGRIAFFVTVAGMLAPLLSVGSILMTVDPLAVLFWTAAMVCGWKAVKEDSFRSWVWLGVWVGFGFLSKYSTPIWLFSWAFFFILSKSARVQLRKPGFYVAVVLSLVFSLPVLIWNYQNDWISFYHVIEHGETGKAWHPTLRFFGDFTGSELGLLNPVFFCMTFWAAIRFWKRRNMLTLYLFSLGGPLFAAYWLYTFHSRVLPNWIAPTVISLFALAGIYWGELEKTKPKLTKRLYVAGFIIGLIMVIPLHDTNLITKVSGCSLPAKIDPLRRVRAWSTLGEQVEAIRSKMEAETGKPCFVIGSHYGITGQLSFEIPKARESLNPPVKPLVFYMHSTWPENQFYFWPSYRTLRVGENAIFVTEEDQPVSIPPERITEDFDRVENLGYYEIKYRGRVFRSVQIFACMGCKPLD